jgi:hypothetical protein
MKAPFLAKLALRQFRRNVLTANHDIKSFIKSSSAKRQAKGWPAPDAKFFADPAWLKAMYAAMAEGFRQPESVQAIYQEHALFMNPWNEPIEAISPEKVIVWQGAQDKTCPVANAQQLAERIKGCCMEIFADEGHCLIFAKQKELAAALRV